VLSFGFSQSAILGTINRLSKILNGDSIRFRTKAAAALPDKVLDISAMEPDNPTHLTTLPTSVFVKTSTTRIRKYVRVPKT
jgi:hypothetical protein